MTTTTIETPKKPILVWIVGIGLVILSLLSAVGLVFMSPTMQLPPEMPPAQVAYIRSIDTIDVALGWIIAVLGFAAGALFFDMRKIALPLLALLFVASAGYYGFEIATAKYAETFGWAAVAIGIAPSLFAMLYAFAIRNRLT